MELKRFRVTNFRSVDDSDWIEISRLTALIGVNESGKTNLLLPLWKLNPAREGEIHPTSDYPKKMFGTIRANPGAFCFITAEFSTGALADKIAAQTGAAKEHLSRVVVQRFFDGKYAVDFPDANLPRTVKFSKVESLVSAAAREIGILEPAAEDAAFKVQALVLLDQVGRPHLPDDDVDVAALRRLEQQLAGKSLPPAAANSAIAARLKQLQAAIMPFVQQLTKADPAKVEGVFKTVTDELPKFLYYSNYGNLDSEIYLPHVVQNLEREDLGNKEAAKARTLRVLFNFVQLSAGEILELGKEPTMPANTTPTDAQIAIMAEKKRERSILLQSASAKLTQEFRKWWKQGDYRFRFEADGNHFRIWVADDRRPEEIELENRSTGLQWFLSFYLVFLVESEAAHRDAVLLLDEPGLSLHPLAQRDLSKFFDGLTSTNQILYTTHSPFLVDADHLDRARKIYVAPDGTTKATENLREGKAETGHRGAAYAVHSALNLTIAESLLLGCQPIIVEGTSDQHYLTGMKTVLIQAGRITPARELVFPPSGGAKTARMVASILTGRDDALPVVLLDDDVPGRKMAKEMKTSLYEANPDRVLNVATFRDMDGAETEDLFPATLIAEAVDRLFRAAEPEDEFAVKVEASKPLVLQIEQWAGQHAIDLPQGWKVLVAKQVKQYLLGRGLTSVDPTFVARWVRLFNEFEKPI